MELASSIFYGYGTAGAGRQLIAHEMAHQFFGDSVTEADWDDVWLSEGFATYFALLYQEFADGHDAFVDGVRRSKTQAVNYAINNPASTIVHNNLADISKVIANNAQIYQGGAQVLQNIRGVIGTQPFWEGIRAYYARFMNGTARTDDLRHAFEEACKSAADRCPAAGKDLSWLFTELLNKGGALQVTGTWSYNASAKQIEVSLDQTQTTSVYRMPIEVRITAAAKTTRVIELTQAHQAFSWPSDSEPTAVEIDPDAWVFGKLTLTKK
jgi:aminopeptidase N